MQFSIYIEPKEIKELAELFKENALDEIKEKEIAKQETRKKHFIRIDPEKLKKEGHIRMVLKGCGRVTAVTPEYWANHREDRTRCDEDMAKEIS